MLLNQASLPEGSRLQSGNFYIPRLGQLNAPQHLPVSMSRFVAKYRVLFDDEIHIPKRLELSEFGDLADHIHILLLGQSRETWTFQRFAPYNRRLEEKLARLLREKSPFYVGTHIDEIGGECVAHRLFIPMSD